MTTEQPATEGTGGGRSRLLAAAHALFPTHGYRAVTVAQILQASGVQAPTLYYHFQDKEGLYMAWLEEALQGLGERLRAATDQHSTHYLRLHAFVRTLMDETSLDLYQVRHDAPLMRRAESHEAKYQMLYAHVYEPLMTLLVDAMGSGMIAGHPVERMAHWLVLSAVSFRPGYTLQPISTNVAADWLVSCFLHGVSASDPTR